LHPSKIQLIDIKAKASFLRKEAFVIALDKAAFCFLINSKETALRFSKA